MRREFAIAACVAGGGLLVLGVLYVLTRKAEAWSNGQKIGTVELETVDGVEVEKRAAARFRAMRAAAARAGVRLVLTSGFRRYAHQAALHAAYTAKLAAWKAAGSPAGMKPTPAARPGYSNHQNGRALDIATGGNNPDSPSYRWLAAHAHEHGYANTGAKFSPPEFWHWEFTG